MEESGIYISFIALELLYRWNNGEWRMVKVAVKEFV
jgi:hypothetical protein